MTRVLRPDLQVILEAEIPGLEALRMLNVCEVSTDRDRKVYCRIGDIWVEHSVAKVCEHYFDDEIIAVKRAADMFKKRLGDGNAV
jgi:hypothetical protein